jgi:hypothetical protein
MLLVWNVRYKPVFLRRSFLMKKSFIWLSQGAIFKVKLTMNHSAIKRGRIMDLLQNIHNLPTIEKIKVMEFIWAELTSDDSEFVTPTWHEDELIKTEKRMTEGKEQIMDWAEAKQLLRNEFR